MAGVDGIGFAIQDSSVVFIDLDHCIDPTTGEIAPWAKKIVGRDCKLHGSLAERNRSAHLHRRGSPEGPRVKDLEDGGRVEFYDGGRYTTVTGLQLKGTPTDIVACPRLAEIYERVIARAPRASRSAAPQAIDQHRNGGSPHSSHLTRKTG